MATLRGASGAAYQNSNTSTLTLPSGTVAGDMCVAILGNVWNGSSLSAGITSWDYNNKLDTYGNTWLLAKQLTAADITAGSVTATFTGSGPGYSAIATCQASMGMLVALTSHTNPNGVVVNTLVANGLQAGDILVYLTTHRRDGVTPTATISDGTLVNESGFNGGSNWGMAGGIRHRTVSGAENDTTDFTYDAGGQGDMAAIWMFTDTPRPGATMLPAAAASKNTNARLYKGRPTAAADSGSVV